MTHDEMIAVIQAQHNRKTIEYRKYHGSDIEWHILAEGRAFDFINYEYRIKPESRQQPNFDIGDKITCFYETAIITDRRFSDGVWQYLIEDTTWVTEKSLSKHKSKEEKLHYRPFKNAKEVMEAIKEHGSWLRHNGRYYNITEMTDAGFCEGTTKVLCTWEEALIKCEMTFIDETPFGKLED